MHKMMFGRKKKYGKLKLKRSSREAADVELSLEAEVQSDTYVDLEMEVEVEEGEKSRKQKHVSTRRFVVEEVFPKGVESPKNFGMVCVRVGESSVMYHGIDGLFFYDFKTKHLSKENLLKSNFRNLKHFFKSKRKGREIKSTPKLWNHTTIVLTEKEIREIELFSEIGEIEKKRKERERKEKRKKEIEKLKKITSMQDKQNEDDLESFQRGFEMELISKNENSDEDTVNVDAWRTESKLKKLRQQVDDPSYSAERLGNVPRKVIIFGGSTGYSENSRLESSGHIYEYDLINNLWEKKFCSGKIPKIRKGHSVFYHNGKMYMFGGSGFFLAQTRELDVYILDLKTLSWSVVKPDRKPVKRYSQCCVRIDKDRVLMGFGQFSQAYNDVFLYYISTNKWYRRETSGEEPCGRGYCTANKYRKDVYFFGGRYTNGERFNTLYKLSTINWKWSQIELTFNIRNRMMPTVSGHCSIIIDGKLLIFGGNTDDGRSNRMFEISLPKTLPIKMELFSDLKIMIEEY